jgi:hypothetical protein
VIQWASQGTSINVSALQNEILNVSQAILSSAKKHRFLRVAADRIDYIDQPALFGDAVSASFPSAARDIQEAGNCLAAENNTAAVFHLMRAAEVALRALAKDRGVSYPDASVSSKQIGDLLSALDGKVIDLRRADAKLWPSKDLKDVQIKFYHMALAELRDFNEAWRKSMSHGHEGAFYDRGYAEDILKHVRSFMQAVSVKISEAVTTPPYWISA